MSLNPTWRSAAPAGGPTDVFLSSNSSELFTPSQNPLRGRLPERLAVGLGSCHGNRGAWQLMFHLQINYGVPLMEESVFLLPFVSLQNCGALTSQRRCDTHTETPFVASLKTFLSKLRN